MASCVSPGGTDSPLPRGQGAPRWGERTWPSRDPGPQAVRILADAHAAVRTWEELVWNPRPGGLLERAVSYGSSRWPSSTESADTGILRVAGAP